MHTNDFLLSNFKTKCFNSVFVTYDVVLEMTLTIHANLETLRMSLFLRHRITLNVYKIVFESCLHG